MDKRHVHYRAGNQWGHYQDYKVTQCLSYLFFFNLMYVVSDLFCNLLHVVLYYVCLHLHVYNNESMLKT